MSMLILERIMPRYRGEDLSDDVYSMLGERTATELVEEPGGSRANVSKHLRALLEVGLVEWRKQSARTPATG